MRAIAIIAIIFGMALCAISIAGIEPTFMATRPTPTSAISRQIVRRLPKSSVILDEVPTSRWAYGCAVTAARMIFGYYDRHDYPDMYLGWGRRTVAPLRNLGHRTALVASKRGRDRNRSRGHVDDYWVRYGASGPDPWQTKGRDEHTWDCVADFLGTNQWKWDYYGSDGRVKLKRLYPQIQML